MMQRGHLNEIFVNVLLNAREAMPNGGEIRVTARPGGRLLGRGDHGG